MNKRGHELRIEFNRIIPQLCRRDRLQALTSLRKVRVPLHPSEAVHMNTSAALEFILAVSSKARFEKHIDPVCLRSGLEEWHVEEVAVKSGHYGGLYFLDVREESAQRRSLLVFLRLLS